MTRRHLLDLVVEQIDARPDAVAIVDGDATVRYRQLGARAAEVAARLAQAGVGPGDRVAVYVPKSADAIATFLACLSLGSPYVPIDLGSPVARAARMMSVANPAAVVTEHRGLPLVEAVSALGDCVVPVVNLDLETGHGDWGPFGLAPGADGKGVAHLLFTSGSTGAPKAVAVGIENVAHFVSWATDHFGIDPGARISGHSPFHFDLSTFDIYGALTSGAELHLVPGPLNVLPHKLADWIRTQRLTHWFSVPTTLGQLVDNGQLQLGDFPDLRELLWCGEALATPVLRRLMALLPHARFTNLYGPTETTIASSFHVVTSPPASDLESIPIGLPIPGEALSVRDGEGREVPVGEKGEIHIAGAGVTRGYWQDPERTAAVFIDGGSSYRTGDVGYRDEQERFHVAGRLDNQIKFRGHRIELGDIEAGLMALPSVEQAAVVLLDVGRPTIAACVVLADGAELRPCRADLAELLPAYMIPAQWEQVESLPHNSNGKVDRNQVRALLLGLGSR